MAKNITLLGASYPAVPAVVLPQTGGGNATFVDPVELIDDNAGAGVTDKTWSADKLVEEFADTEMSAELTTAAPIQSFPDGAPYPMSLQFAIEPVQAGSGDPSPSNVRPISGFDGANVTVTGKNILPLTISEIKAKNTSGSWSGNVYTQNGLTFTIVTDADNNVTGIRLNQTNTSGSAFTFGITNEDFGDDNFASDSPSASSQYKAYTGQNNDGASTQRLQYQANNHSIYIRIGSGASFSNVVITPMICFATVSDTTFEPYKGNVYQITFPSAAGTVYGATVTVNPDGTGELVVDRAKITLTGSDFITESGTLAGRFFTDSWIINQNKLERRDFLCNMATTVTGTLPQSTPNVTYISSNMQVVIVTTGYTLAQFQTYLNSNPYELVYGVKPVTYSLTPGQVLALLGQTTNVWADTGDIKALSYVRNTVPELIRQDTEGQIKSTLELTIAELWNI